MSTWIEVVNCCQRHYDRKATEERAQSGMRSPEWHCAQCSVRTFLNRDTCRRRGKSKDVTQDTFIDKWAQVGEWSKTDTNVDWGAPKPLDRPDAQQVPSCRQGSILLKQKLQRCPTSASRSWRTSCSRKRQPCASHSLRDRTWIGSAHPSERR